MLRVYVVGKNGKFGKKPAYLMTNGGHVLLAVLQLAEVVIFIAFLDECGAEALLLCIVVQ